MSKNGHNEFINELRASNVLCLPVSENEGANESATKQLKCISNRIGKSFKFGHVALTLYKFHEKNQTTGTFIDAHLHFFGNAPSVYQQSISMYGFLRPNNFSLTDFLFKSPKYIWSWVFQLGNKTQMKVKKDNSFGSCVLFTLSKEKWDVFLKSSASLVTESVKDHQLPTDNLHSYKSLIRKAELSGNEKKLREKYSHFIKEECDSLAIQKDILDNYSNVKENLTSLTMAFGATLLAGESSGSVWSHSSYVLFAASPVFLEDTPNNVSERCCAGLFLVAVDEKNPLGLMDELVSNARFISTYWTYNSYQSMTTTRIMCHARKSATAAIMSRNMSHNLGSHTLANSRLFESIGILDYVGDTELKLTKKEVAEARGRLQTFNQYQQGRMDFIARKLSEDGDKPEPLFLINDVIQGFMSQSVLLNTLLDDLGYRLNNIELHLHGFNEDSEQKTALVWKADKERPEGIKDKLVGIAGGQTGCHSLYATLENLLRNATKYSNREWENEETAKLELHIEILDAKDRNDEDCYCLQLWENLTDDKDGEIIKSVRNALKQDIIDQNGEPIKGGHGIQEMKLCSEYTADTLTFLDDKVCEGLKEKGFNADYAAFLKDNLSEDIIALSHPKFRAYNSEEEGRSALVYEMLIPKPLLLGITCVRNGEYGTVCDPKSPEVKRYNDLLSMGKNNLYFGLILAHDAEDETIKKTLCDVARWHNTLPFRLLVVTREEDHKKWKKAIKLAMADGQSSRYYPLTKEKLEEAIKNFNPTSTDNPENITPILPHRRVHVIEDEDFFPNTLNCGEQLHGIETEEEWRKRTLSIYNKWIKVWKGTPLGDDEHWKLMIGFERDRQQIQDRWEKPLNTNKENWKTLMDVYVVAKGSDEATGWSSASNIPPPAFSCLVFDNHGHAFGAGREYKENARFWHHFSGNEISLYQMLESPPPNGFGFSFFMFSLLEACLTNIVTLDERVADATLKKDRRGKMRPDRTLDGKLGIMRKSGIHPLFSIGTTGQQVEGELEEPSRSSLMKKFITPNIIDYLLSLFDSKNDNSKNSAKELLRNEGIRFGKQPEGITVQEISIEGDDPKLENINNPDILVIHEGITDSLAKQDLWDKGDHFALYSLMPGVIRTSGRGNQSRELGSELPFIELNVLSDSCYGSLNKIKLARALLSAVGGDSESKEGLKELD